MASMKVAFIHPFLYRFPRGIERYTFNLANALSAGGDSVHLLTWRWPTAIKIDELDPAVQVHLLPTSRYYAAQAIVPFYTAHLLRHQYDMVWIFFAGYGESEAMALVRRSPFGIVLHFPFDAVPHRYREFVRYGTAKRAQRIVAVSQYVADGAKQFFGREIDVFGHGVNTARFSPNPTAREQVRVQLGLPPDAVLLMTAAALEERKGVQWMVRAFPHVLRHYPTVHYVVLGDGPYRPSLEQLARESGVSGHVHLVGSRADVVPFYQAADLAVILSRREASSLTTLEALACGVPVVAAAQRPFDELIAPEYGVCVPEEDSELVARTIVSLLKDPQRRHAMGLRGQSHVATAHTWKQIATQYRDLTSATMASRSANRPTY